MDKHTESAAKPMGRLTPASTMEEVDEWLARYMAAGEAARAEAARIERLHDAAPELFSLLQDAVDSFGPHLEGGDDEWLIAARAALAKAGGAK